MNDCHVIKITRILIAFAGLCLGACDGGQPGSGPSRTFALKKQSGPGDAVTLNPVGPFLTSPVWLADGKGIVARGYLGKGLYVVGQNDAPLRTIHPGYSGHVAWIDEGRSFCLSLDGDSEIFDYNIYSGKLTSTRFENRACEAGLGMEAQERIVHEAPGLQIFFDSYRGGIRITEKGADKQVESFGAWGVTVSHDGRRIAYALGPLRRSTLFVYDSEKGKTGLGTGAFPSWFPDGKRLVFTAHEAQAHASGEIRIIRSDLVVHNVETSVSVRLTNTPSIVEMQPAVSPSGDFIACSDWQSGALLVLATGEAVVP